MDVNCAIQLHRKSKGVYGREKKTTSDVDWDRMEEFLKLKHGTRAFLKFRRLITINTVKLLQSRRRSTW